jgi:hypothetical protein
MVLAPHFIVMPWRTLMMVVVIVVIMSIGRSSFPNHIKLWK